MQQYTTLQLYAYITGIFFLNIGQNLPMTLATIGNFLPVLTCFLELNLKPTVHSHEKHQCEKLVSGICQ